MRLNKNLVPPYLKREKLISELLMAFKQHLDKYEGIELKRLKVQIKKMEFHLREIKLNPELNIETKIKYNLGIFYIE